MSIKQLAGELLRRARVRARGPGTPARARRWPQSGV